MSGQYQSNISRFFQEPAPPPQDYATGFPVDQQNVAPHPIPINGKWTSSLCGCCGDFPNCCLTCWCPCITFGQVAEFLDQGNTSCGIHGAIYAIIAAFTCCGCLYSCQYRTKMRELYGLPETNSCNDCLVHFLCERCALCQEYRELKNRGFDMSIGWQANMERHGVQMPPIPPGGMPR